MAYRLVKKTIDDVQVGDRYWFAKTVTEADVVVFAGVSGDLAPLHVHAEYAKSTPFGERIAHGTLVGSLATAAIGRMLPTGFAPESCEFRFTSPVRIGDTVTANVEVAEKDSDRGRLRMKVECVNQKGEVVLEGSVVLEAIELE